MLNQFRNIASGFASKILLAFLVLTFAVWGIEDMVRAPGGRNTVATVGNTTISIEVFQSAFRRDMDELRQSMGDNFSPEFVKALHPEKRTLQRLVRQQLLEQETKALGIAASDEDVVSQIRNNPRFTGEDGRFSKELFEMTLKGNRISEKNYVEKLRHDLSSSLLLQAVTPPVSPTEIALQTLLNTQNERRAITLYTLTDASTGSTPTPSTAELEQFFSEHASAFVAPEYRRVSVLLVNPQDAKQSVHVSEEDLLSAYKDRIDEFKRPETRTLDQLLFADEKDAVKAAEALTSGKSFDEVAKTSPIMNKGSLSLGKVERGRVMKEAAEDVFALQKGGVTKPIQSPFGWHIFRVRDIEPPSVASLNDVKTMLEKEVRQTMLEGAQTKYLNKIEDALAGGSSFPEAAKEFGLKLQSYGPFTKDGKSPDGTAAKLPKLDQFLKTAFNTDAKAESPMVRTEDGTYYVVHVDEVMAERSRTLDEVRNTVIAAWRQATQAKRLAEAATEAAKKMADSKTRDAAIAEYKLKLAFQGSIKRNGDKAGDIALPTAMIADVFSKVTGDATGAHALPSGGFAIAVAGQRIAGEKPDPAIAQQVEKSVEQDMRQEILESYFLYLADKYPVSVNDAVLKAVSE